MSYSVQVPRSRTTRGVSCAQYYFNKGDIGAIMAKAANDQEFVEPEKWKEIDEEYWI